jgi:hypothetical protein
LYRRFLWYNEEDRLTATVYYTIPDPVTCESLLVVHVAAASWLAEARRQIAPVAEIPAPAPVSNGETPRLFP